MIAGKSLTLKLLPDELSIARLDAAAPIPDWALKPGTALISITRTAGELSIVAPSRHLPETLRAEAPWRALAVDGPLDFALIGILAELASALASARVSLFAISTFDTDLLLVRAPQLEAAIGALRRRGHDVID